VEIDYCQGCGGIWLDEGEFSRIQDEIKAARVAPPGWAAAIAKVAAQVRTA
jgi:Zn-finger nucleic acid-binding protein